MKPFGYFVLALWALSAIGETKEPQSEPPNGAPVWITADEIRSRDSTNTGKATKNGQQAGAGINSNCRLSHTLGFRIVQKINTKFYEMNGDMVMAAPHAILATKTVSFDRTGIPVGITMKHVGDKAIELSNGFSTMYQFWEECEASGDVGCTPNAVSPFHSAARKINCRKK